MVACGYHQCLPLPKETLEHPALATRIRPANGFSAPLRAVRGRVPRLECLSKGDKERMADASRHTDRCNVVDPRSRRSRSSPSLHPIPAPSISRVSVSGFCPLLEWHRFGVPQLSRRLIENFLVFLPRLSNRHLHTEMLPCSGPKSILKITASRRASPDSPKICLSTGPRARP